MLKTYQFKTHCKGDSHSSRTANISTFQIVIQIDYVAFLVRGLRLMTFSKILVTVYNFVTCKVRHLHSVCMLAQRIINDRSKWMLSGSRDLLLNFRTPLYFLMHSFSQYHNNIHNTFKCKQFLIYCEWEVYNVKQATILLEQFVDIAEVFAYICTSNVTVIITRATRSKARYMLRQRGWLAGWVAVCHTGIVSKRLNLS